MEAKHSIMHTWQHDVVHHYVNTYDKTTADTRIQQMIDFMHVENVEDIDNDPQIIDQLRQSLSDYVQVSGKNKGKHFSVKTIKEYFRLLRRVIKVHDENHKLKNFETIWRKTSSEKFRTDKNLTKKERLPLNNEDYKKLFTFLAELKKHRFAQLNFMLKMHPEYKKDLITIKNYPDAFLYTIMIALFTGSRANAITTLRHQDIDLENKIFKFNKNDQSDDAREKLKHLKTDESKRSVPIADVLLNELGLEQYLKTHEKLHGSEAFIFEEAIKNNNSYSPNIINLYVNTLFSCLEIKPDKDSTYMKDFHSLKKSFYSANCKTGIPLEMLEALAGNKPSNGSLAAKVYTQISMETAAESMFEAVNNISYPFIELLIGKKIEKSTNVNDLIKDYVAKVLGEPIKRIIVIQ